MIRCTWPKWLPSCSRRWGKWKFQNHHLDPLFWPRALPCLQLFMSDKNIAWNGIAVEKVVEKPRFVHLDRKFFFSLLLLAAAGRLAIRQLRWMILEGEVDVIPSIFDGSISLDLRCEVSKHHSYSYLLEKWYLQCDLNGWIRIKDHLENKEIQYF